MFDQIPFHRLQAWGEEEKFTSAVTRGQQPDGPTPAPGPGPTPVANGPTPAPGPGPAPNANSPTPAPGPGPALDANGPTPPPRDPASVIDLLNDDGTLNRNPLPHGTNYVDVVGKQTGLQCDTAANLGIDGNFCLCIGRPPLSTLCDSLRTIDAASLVTAIETVDCPPPFLDVANYVTQGSNCMGQKLCEYIITRWDDVRTRDEARAEYSMLARFHRIFPHICHGMLLQKFMDSVTDLDGVRDLLEGLEDQGLTDTIVDRMRDLSGGRLTPEDMLAGNTEEIVSSLELTDLRESLQNADRETKGNISRALLGALGRARREREELIETTRSKSEQRVDRQESRRDPNPRAVFALEQMRPLEQASQDEIKEVFSNGADTNIRPEEITSMGEKCCINGDDVYDGITRRVILREIKAQCEGVEGFEMDDKLKTARSGTEIASDLSGQTGNFTALRELTRPFANEKENLNKDQMRNLVSSLEPVVSQNDFENLNADTVADMAPVVTAISMADLETAPYAQTEEGQNDLCEAFKDAVFTEESTAEIRAKYQFCVQDGMNPCDSGNMMAGMQASDIEGMAEADVSTCDSSLASMPRSREARKAVLDTVSGGDVSSLSSTQVTSLATAIVENMDPAEISTHENIVEQLPALLQSVEASEARCQTEVCSQQDRQMYQDTDMKRELVNSLIASYVASQSGSTRRRKRSTTVTCAELVLADTVYPVVSMDTDVIATISCDAFMTAQGGGCIENLNVDGLLASQLQALATLAGTCLSGGADTWTEAQQTELGVILLGVSDLSPLNLTIGATVESIGEKVNSMPSVTALETAYSQYKTQNEVAAAADLTNQQVADLGLILCGMPADDVTAMDNAAYQENVAMIGGLVCFMDAQFTAWAEKAVAVYGAEDTITAAEIADIGSGIVSMSTTFYESLTSDKITEIGQKFISLLSDASLVAMDVAVEHLSAGQANQLTMEQLTALTEEQCALVANILDQESCLPVEATTSASVTEESGGGGGGGGGGGDETTEEPDNTDDETTEEPDDTDDETTEEPDDTDDDTTGEPDDTDDDTTGEPDTDDDTTGEPDTDDDTTGEPDTDDDTTGEPEGITEEPQGNGGDGNGGDGNGGDGEGGDGNGGSGGQVVFSADTINSLNIEELTSEDFQALTVETMKVASVASQLVARADEKQVGNIYKTLESYIDGMIAGTETVDTDFLLGVMNILPRNKVEKITDLAVVETLISNVDDSLEEGLHALRTSVDRVLTNAEDSKIGEKFAAAKDVLFLASPAVVGAALAKTTVDDAFLEGIQGGELSFRQAKLIVDKYLTDQSEGLKDKTAEEQMTLLNKLDMTLMTAMPLADLNAANIIPVMERTKGSQLKNLMGVSYDISSLLNDNAQMISLMQMLRDNKNGDLSTLTAAEVERVVENSGSTLSISDITQMGDKVCDSAVSYGSMSVLSAIGQQIYDQCFTGTLTVDTIRSKLQDQLQGYAPATKISTDVNSAAMVKKFCDVSIMPRNKMDALAEAAAKIFNPATTSSFDDFACVFPYFSLERLETVSEANRPALCREMACVSTVGLTYSDLDAKLAFCLPYVTCKELACPKPKIGSFPTLISALRVKHFNVTSKFQCSHVPECLFLLGLKVPDCATRKHIVECAKAEGVGLNNAVNLWSYGTLADQFTATDWTGISDAHLCGLSGRVDQQVKDQLLISTLQMNYIPSADCAGVTSSLTSLIDRLATLENSGTCTGAARRRRAGTAYTCKDIKAKGFLSSSWLSTEDIAAIINSEFAECADALGMVKTFTAAQWKAVADRAKEVWGAVDTWTVAEITSAGGIVSGLSADDIAKLEISDMNAIKAVGSYGVWDSNKLAAAFTQVTTDLLGGDVSNVEGDHLYTMGHLVCGATSQDIGNIKPQHYCNAASGIGRQSYCTASQLQAFAAHAKDSKCFGADVTKWTPANVKAVGNVVGGLTKEEVAMLSKEQIQNIEPWSIGSFPEMQMNGFTEAQLVHFDLTQFNALTGSQYMSLDAAKQEYVVSRTMSLVADGGMGYLVPDTTERTDNGAELLEASAMLLVTGLMAVLLRI